MQAAGDGARNELEKEKSDAECRVKEWSESGSSGKR